MITGFFLSLFLSLASFFVALLPSVAFPASLSAAISTAFGYLNMFSYLFPVATLLTVIGFALLYYIVVFGLDISLWVIHLVRGR